MKIYQRWVAGVDEACSFNLAQPLIVRDEETNFIDVNFDPQVTSRNIYRGHRSMFRCDSWRIDDIMKFDVTRSCLDVGP